MRPSGAMISDSRWDDSQTRDLRAGVENGIAGREKHIVRIACAEAQRDGKARWGLDAFDQASLRVKDVERVAPSGRDPHSAQSIDRQSVGVSPLQHREFTA